MNAVVVKARIDDTASLFLVKSVGTAKNADDILKISGYEDGNLETLTTEGSFTVSSAVYNSSMGQWEEYPLTGNIMASIEGGSHGGKRI